MDLAQAQGEFERCFAQRQFPAALAVCDTVLSGRSLRKTIRAEWLSRKAAALMTANPGWYRRAIAMLKEANTLVKGFPESKVRVLASLSAAYRKAGDPALIEQVLGDYLLLQTIHPSLEMTSIGARIYYNYGLTLKEDEQFERAEAAYRSALAGFQTAPDGAEKRLYVALAQDQLAGVYMEQNRLTEAQALLDQAHPVLSDSQWGAYLRWRKARLHQLKGDLQGADRLCQEAEMHPSAEDRTRADILYTRATIAAEAGNCTLAATHATSASELALRAVYPQLMSRIQKFLVQIRREV